MAPADVRDRGGSAVEREPARAHARELRVELDGEPWRGGVGDRVGHPPVLHGVAVPHEIPGHGAPVRVEALHVARERPIGDHAARDRVARERGRNRIQRDGLDLRVAGRHALDQRPVRRVVGVRAVRAPAGDGAVDERGVDARERGVVGARGRGKCGTG